MLIDVSQTDRERNTERSVMKANITSGLRQCFPVASPSSLGSRCLSLSLSTSVCVCCWTWSPVPSHLPIYLDIHNQSSYNLHGLAHLDAARLFSVFLVFVIACSLTIALLVSCHICHIQHSLVISGFGIPACHLGSK